MARKAAEVTLSDKTVVLVQEPGARDLGAFFRTLPALKRLSDVMENQQGNSSVIMPDVSLSDQETGQIIELLDRTTKGLPEGTTVGDLSMFDLLALFMAMGQLMPQDFSAPSQVP